MMSGINWKDNYLKKCVTAQEAAAVIQSGDKIILLPVNSMPIDILNALVQSSQELVIQGVRIKIAKASREQYFGDAAPLAHRMMEMEDLDAVVVLLGMEGKIVLVARSKVPELDVARVMNISGYSLFKKFIFPEALPNILTGTRIAMSNALIIVVVTEMFIGTSIGIGHRIIDNQMVYNIPEMYSAILIIGTVGYILNKLFIRYEKRIVHWSGR